MIALILLLAICGTSQSCTEFSQLCYKCRGDTHVCNDGSYIYTTADECIDLVMSDPSKVSAHYKPSNGRCFLYTCDNNLYFSDSTRFSVRETCNVDCTNFTLTEYSYARITNQVLWSYYTNRGQCFEDCFETYGCYSFSYNWYYGICSIFTTCGVSCDMVYDGYETVYTRTCHAVTDCGTLADPENGDVVLSGGTTVNHVATYTCSLGFLLNGNNTRTCQADAVWSGSEPSCNATDCGPLSPPSDGTVNVSSGTTYSEVATYACSVGFNLNGNDTRTCQADAVWSGSEPSCIATDCGPLSPPSDGTVNVTSGTTYSEVATYACSVGFNLNGNDTRTCQADAVWSGSEPSCNATDCGPLSPPSDGTVNVTSGTTYSEVATYACSVGFNLNGNDTRTCQADAVWSGSEPSCIVTDCGPLTQPSDGEVDTPSGTTYNSTANYSCLDGFHLQGPGKRTCQVNSKWTGSVPQCIASDCGSLTPPSNGTVDVSSGTTYGNIATYTCSDGYTLNGNNTRTCQDNAIWSGSEPDCIAADCGPLTSPSDGTVNVSSGTTYGNIATYTCSDGYRLNGNNTRTCQDNAIWSGSEPDCIASDCGPLTPPSDGTVNVSSGTYGDIATYSCSDGYTLNGNNTRTCQVNATWSGSEPDCIASDCGPLTPPSNGTVNVSSGTTYGNIATYTCSDGYTLNGNNTRTCQDHAIWSGSEPDCIVADCGPLTPSSDGTVNVSSGTTYGNIATYTCSDGYRLNGNNTRTCQDNAIWSGSGPDCIASDCGPLTPPSDGTVNVSSGTYGDIATYSCSDGYTLNGNNTRTCQVNATWSGSEPDCIASDCGPLTPPSNGTVDVSSGTTYGNIATYSCSDGYVLNGNNTRTCQDNANWNGSEPNCIVADCGPLTPPSDGFVNVSSGTTYGNIATYSCNDGYTLNGNNTRTCQTNAAWSGFEPACVTNLCDTLTLPPNGTISTSSGTAVYSIATYTCLNGYVMLGNNTRLCRSDGFWSGFEPVCAAIDCGILASPINGTVSMPTGTTYSNQAIYACSTGYTLQGDDIRICQSNGNWTGPVPSCSVVDCGSLSAPENGIVQTPAGTTFQELAMFNCLAGYYLSGNNTRTCMANGNWSDSQPVCYPVDCGIPGAPVNGTVSSNGTTFGQNATFSCNTGFSLNGLAERACNANGIWDSPPSCSITDCGNLTAPVNGIVAYSNVTTYGGTALFQCNSGYYLSHLNERTCLANGFWSMSTPLCVPDGTTVPERKKLYIAPCICYSNKTFTNMTREEIFEYLIRATSIQTNSTALARSKLISAPDSRVSSQIIGYAGVGIILGALGLFLLSDLLTVCQTFWA